jgi:hypothetical protein
MRRAHPGEVSTGRTRQQLTQLLNEWAHARATPQRVAASRLGSAIVGLMLRPRRSRRFRETRAWCWNDDQRDSRAFRDQCDVLGLAPERLRHHLQAFLGKRAAEGAHGE